MRMSILILTVTLLLAAAALTTPQTRRPHTGLETGGRGTAAGPARRSHGRGPRRDPQGPPSPAPCSSQGNSHQESLSLAQSASRSGSRCLPASTAPAGRAGGRPRQGGPAEARLPPGRGPRPWLAAGLPRSPHAPTVNRERASATRTPDAGTETPAAAPGTRRLRSRPPPDRRRYGRRPPPVPAALTASQHEQVRLLIRVEVAEGRQGAVGLRPEELRRDILQGPAGPRQGQQQAEAEPTAAARHPAPPRPPAPASLTAAQGCARHNRRLASGTDPAALRQRRDGLCEALYGRRG